jgi:aminoglycoside phosphotransferase (APT) family kinase protein
MLKDMARPSLTLAALATAAVPGLEVSAVRLHRRGEHGAVDSAVIATTDGRELIIRLPTSQAAESEQSADLVALRALTTGVRARLPFAVPAYVGQAPFSGTRALVYDFLPGEVHPADELTADASLATSVGRAIAAVHSLPTSFVGEAGLPHSSAAEARAAAIALITRAADTGRLPAALLRRWEEATDDGSLWQFASTVVNGSLTAESFLIDGDRVSAIIGWSGLRVGDPARDLHWLLSARGEAAETAFAEYAAGRRMGSDDALARRSLLYGELELARWLLHGMDSHDPGIVDDAVTLLDGLVTHVHAASTSPLSAQTGPIMAVTDVEQMLDRTPRETVRRDPGSTLLTDSYDQSDFERGAEGERMPDQSETAAIPLDLTGFGESHAAEVDSSSEADDAADSTADSQSARRSASS